jgi:outer membrane protein assembly factor BamB
LILAACGAQGINTNWPGLSTDGENIFVAYGPGVIAYAAETQQQLWSFPPEPSATLSFFAAPSIQEDRVVLGDFGAAGGFFSPQVVVGLYGLRDAQSNSPQTLWTENELATGSIVAAPLQIGDQVFVGSANNFVYALDGNTGQPVWPEPFKTDHGIWGTPAYKDGVLFVNSLDRTVYALDAATGRMQWSQNLEGALASAPVVNESLVYVTSFDSKLYALDADSGDISWTATAEDWIWGSPAYDDGNVYFADVKGNVYSVSGSSGEQNWRQQIGGSVQTSPVVNGNAVYIGSEGASTEEQGDQGLLTALAVETGQQLWQVSTPAPLYSTPVIVGEEIVVVVQHETAFLIAYDVASGAQRWQIAPPQ